MKIDILEPQFRSVESETVGVGGQKLPASGPPGVSDHKLKSDNHLAGRLPQSSVSINPC